MNPRHRRPRRTATVPIAAMGDIAFLLIIFFMVCSNFAKDAGLRLEPPAAPRLDELRESMIAVAIDEEGRIFLQGTLVANAETVEAALTRLFGEGASAAKRTVLFRCDKFTDRAVFEPVLEAIAAAGGIVAAVGEQGAAAQPQ